MQIRKRRIEDYRGIGSALMVFDRNETGNKFWENRGVTVRNDLVYRIKAVKEMVRIDT